MEKPRWFYYCIVLLSLLCCLAPASATESPQYEVVHTESDFEVRLYGESTWISGQSNEVSFQKATLLGWHRLFQYIQGGNLNYSWIPITVPLVTSIVPGAGPFNSSSYFVRFYLPAKFQADPPIPLPKLHLKPYVWDSHYTAVRKFSGYANDDNIAKQAKKLAFSLNRSPWANSTISVTNNAYSIAQYDPPFQYFGRVNEVWADITVSGADGPEPSRVAAY